MTKYIVLKINKDTSEVKLYAKGARFVNQFTIPSTNKWKSEIWYKLIHCIILMIAFVNLAIGSCLLHDMHFQEDYDDFGGNDPTESEAGQEAGAGENVEGHNKTTTNIDGMYCNQSFIDFQLYAEGWFQVLFGIVLVAFICFNAHKHTILGKLWAIFAMTGIFYLSFNFLYSYCIGCDVFSPPTFLNGILSYLVQILCIMVYILHVKIQQLIMNTKIRNIVRAARNIQKAKAKKVSKTPKVGKDELEILNENEKFVQKLQAAHKLDKAQLFNELQ